MEKPIVGQILYSLNIGDAARHCEQELTEVQVIRVGRKYFYCRPPGSGRWTEMQYRLEDWGEHTDCSATSILYLNPQEWIDKKEINDIWKEISETFNYGTSFMRGKNRNDISLNDLRKIRDIISMEEKEGG